MSLSTLKKDRENYYHQFFENVEAGQSLGRTNKADSELNSQENGSFVELGRKIISHLFIIVGGFFLHSSSAQLLFNFMLLPHSTLPRPSQQVTFFIGGLLLMLLDLGKIRKKSDVIPYTVFPLMGAVFSFCFNLGLKYLPVGQPFFYFDIFFFSLALFGFYRAKYSIASSENKAYSPD